MIDPSVKAFLRTKYSIRKFFSVFGGILIVLLLLLVATAQLESSWLREAALAFFGNFAANAAIFLVTYGFYVLVTPPGLRDAEVIPLRDVEISSQIVDLPENASDYWFWGRSGAFFRAKVLPRLNTLAHTERKHIHIRVVLPDPSNNDNSKRYMHLRQGLGEEAGEHTLTAEVVATIAQIAALSARNPYLRAEIGLSASIPVLRFDLSNSGALLTRDARHLPALLVNAGNPYFEMLRDAVESELNQSRRLSWKDGELSNFDAVDVLRHLDSISGLCAINEVAVQTAEKLLTSAEHRYEK